jgi:hypothetical protein
VSLHDFHNTAAPNGVAVGAAPTTAGAGASTTQSQSITANSTELENTADTSTQYGYVTFDNERKYLARVVVVKGETVTVRRFDKKSGEWRTKLQTVQRNVCISLSADEAEASFPGCIAAWNALQSPGEQDGNSVGTDSATPKLAKSRGLDGVLACIIESSRRGLIKEGRRNEAVFAVLKAISDSDLQREVENDTVQNTFENFPTFLVDAPELTHAGSVISTDAYQGAEAIVYLSPMLEFETQAQVNHTVAHEFAHLIRKHYTEPGRARYVPGVAHEDQELEQEADQVAALWGFPRPRKETWLSGYFWKFFKSLKSEKAREMFRKSLGSALTEAVSNG